jgi:HlyD family secretion protein
MKHIFKRAPIALLFLAAAVLIALAFRPEPVDVDTAQVTRGPLQVTVEEDAETRAHDRFTLAAPTAGRLSRILLREGDEVTPRTPIATISPLPLDVRELAEIRARVASAEARQREAAEQLARWDSDHAQAVRDLDRARRLAADGIVAQQDFEQAQTKEAAAAKDEEASKFRLNSAAADVERERAGLVSLEAHQEQGGRMVTLYPSTRSRILRIFEKSERVIPYGTPIAVLSDPNKIEIVADLLSTDAVKVRPGAPVIVENWGGPAPLRAKVRLVEPYGFTKVSALGIEDQRTNVIADFIDPPDGLGDGYRVDVRVVLWESADVLKVPASALFRVGDRWSVFTVDEGRTRLHSVEVGHRNAAEAEILSGVERGAVVVVHPPNDLKANTRVAIRANSAR